MNKKVTPVFLFSLLRSGSTMLLKVLSAHAKISSVSEPYLMLPFCYANKNSGVIAQYSHLLASYGIRNVIQNLPNKEEDYYKFLREFTSNIYTSLCRNNEIYFLDKTPLYFYIIEDIVKIYPNAKFIFLFRNPVQIYASTLTTFSRNRFFRIYRQKNELVLGPELLAKGYKAIKEKAYALTYEDFVMNPKEQLSKVLEYLELDFDQNMLTQYNQQDLRGGRGDPTGIKAYSSIRPDSLSKWKTVFDTPFRKKLLLNYVKGIPDIFFEVSEYSKNEIIDEIKSIKVHYNLRYFKDVTDYTIANMIIKANLHLIVSKVHKWSRDVYIN